MTLFIDYNIAIALVFIVYEILRKTGLCNRIHSFFTVILEFIPPAGIALEVLILITWAVGLLREYLWGLLT